ncbi:MAG: NAD-dependent epimerase/dehydratase family protein [Patescibacteria group bacterium]|nr:NAD-dependent epimerase/dehydratase family protein [Patescibacteria group bacterium]
MSKKILVTGAFGQIGSELVPALYKEYGKDNVVAMGHSNISSDSYGIVEKADAKDKDAVLQIIKKYDIGIIYHLVSLLSVIGEKDPKVTWDINVNGLKNILELGVEFGLQIFWPSSIAAFGPTTPRENTPQETILEPTTMYGVTKVTGENLCRYFNLKYNLDVRSVRYPGILSWKTPPSAGTTEYTIAMLYDGVQGRENTCWLSSETMLPMMYVDDAIKATIDIMKATSSEIKIRGSYNLAAISFTAGEWEKALRKNIPNLKVVYKPDERQKIADSWPKSIDDSRAREDWGWKHEYDLTKITRLMVENLRKAQL